MNIRIKSSDLKEKLIKAGFYVVRKEFPKECIYFMTGIEDLKMEQIIS